MKIKTLFILPALALVISLISANATFANNANYAESIKQPPCCCKKCDCKDCKCSCNDGHCQNCKIHSKWSQGHFFCQCCKHNVNS